MAMQNTHKMMFGLAVIALLLGGCQHAQSSAGSVLEGTWTCTAAWTHVKDGVSVPCAAQQQSLCTENILSVTGTISIGPAQWSETKQGTCYATGAVLYGTWTSVTTVPQNEAARQFERERLDGQSLAAAVGEAKRGYRVRITSRTETRVTVVNEMGRTATCNRL
jgi:hypothetical protein